MIAVSNARRRVSLHPEELAKTIDHTLLRPDATAKDVTRLCREARKYHFATVCVFPYFVPMAADLLRDCDVKVCAVIGFPYGAESRRGKVIAAETAVTQGADELDVVMNMPAMLSGEFVYVRDELTSVVRAVRMKSVNSGRGLTIVKIIIEACYLSNKMKKLACKIVEDSGADFAKTSTGVGPGGATIADVELLRDCLSERVAVKASGGIRTFDEVERMINAGAARIGTSAGVEIMHQFLGHAEVH
jgi:deoxyribose-phosphate aldolase